MQNVTVGRYDKPAEVGYQGWIEPEDKSWIIFVDNDGKPSSVFMKRDSSGQVVE